MVLDSQDGMTLDFLFKKGDYMSFFLKLAFRLARIVEAKV